MFIVSYRYYEPRNFHKCKFFDKAFLYSILLMTDIWQLAIACATHIAVNACFSACVFSVYLALAIILTPDQ